MKARLFSTLVTAVSLLFVLMGILAIPISQIAPRLLAEQRAHALAPALYPGADHMSTRTTTEAGMITESQVFVVQAPVGHVRRWMDSTASGFGNCSLSDPMCFIYKRCDQTAFGGALSFLAYLGYAEIEQPCVSVLVERSVAGNYQTLIHVTYSWPTQ